MTERDRLAERVMAALVACWPDHMLAPTATGLQWGQLVAEAAVTALEDELRVAEPSPSDDPLWPSRVPRDFGKEDVLYAFFNGECRIFDMT